MIVHTYIHKNIKGMGLLQEKYEYRCAATTVRQEVLILNSI